MYVYICNMCMLFSNGVDAQEQHANITLRRRTTDGELYLLVVNTLVN